MEQQEAIFREKDIFRASTFLRYPSCRCLSCSVKQFKLLQKKPFNMPFRMKQYNLHPLAVLSENRPRDMSDALTLKEQGFDLSLGLWTGIFAPVGTADGIQARLEAACEKTMTNQTIVEGMTRVGHAIEFRGRAAFTEFVRKEVDTYTRLLQTAGIRSSD